MVKIKNLQVEHERLQKIASMRSLEMDERLYKILRELFEYRREAVERMIKANSMDYADYWAILERVNSDISKVLGL